MGNMPGSFMDCKACQATRFVAFAARQRMGLFGPLPGSSKQESFIRKSLDPNYSASWTCPNNIDADEKSPIFGYVPDLMTTPHCSVRGQWMDEDSDDASPDDLDSDLNDLIEKIKGFTFIPQRDYCVPDAVESTPVTVWVRTKMFATWKYNSSLGNMN